MPSKGAALVPAFVFAALLVPDTHSPQAPETPQKARVLHRSARKPAAPKRAQDGVAPSGCPSVTVMNAGTAGHCCWPGQTWSATTQACAGTPTCPPDFVVQSDSCICPEGKREGVTTQGHCCWPGQEWSVKEKRCAGAPTSCPQGQTPEGEDCSAVVAAPVKVVPQETTEDLLDKVTPKIKEPVKVVVPTGPKLPEQLTRAEIVEGLKSVEPAVRECHERYGVAGTAMVNVTILGNGQVRSAPVGGILHGTATGDCVEAAVKAARFKQFSGPATSIGYPYILR